MPWNGSGTAQATDGTFTGLAIFTSEKTAAVPITAAKFDAYSADVCTMLQNCQTIDGQTIATIVKITATVNSATGVITIGGVVFANTSGLGGNVYVGNAGNFSGSSANNIGIGSGSLAAVTNGQNNVVIGTGAATSLTSTSSNIVVGGSSATSLATGGGANTIVGYSAATDITTGSGNVVIGFEAGGGSLANISSGTNNIVIGTNCWAPGVSTANGRMSIGNIIYGFANTGTSGTASTGRIAIGTTTDDGTNKLQVAGSVAVVTVGFGLRVKEGSNAKQGVSGAMVAGSVTVANTSVTANSRIFVTRQPGGANAGGHHVSTITAGVSFVITSTNGADTGTSAYQIFEPA